MITVLTNQEFQESSFEELKKDYPRLTREQYERGATLGEWRVMSVGGVIALGKGSGKNTLHHEVFHAACDLVLTGKELKAILAKYGNWEAAAKAYETWKPEQSHGLFAKIYHFFRRLAALLRPNATKNIFRRINSGKVWLRTGTGPGTLPRKMSQFAQAGEQMIEVVDADGNVQRIPISQIQGVIDESGKEVQLSDEDRKELRVFQKGQQVETNSGVTGKVTKVRGWGDKMVLTVQGPEGAVTVKPADVKNIVTEQEQSPGEGPPPEGTKPETKPPANAPEETKLQVPYVPTSKGRSMNTVAPRYMAEAVSSYLKNLQDEIGDLDEFVRDRLDYETKDDLYQVMGAEQIEGVALAIDAIERGTGGFVIGHQTGVGKGRMVAAIMRYAKNQGSGPHLPDGE